MNTLIGSGGVAGLFVVVLGCGSNVQPTPAAGPAPMRTRVNYSLAVPQIAAAECDHELKCGNVGLSLKFSNMQHCTEVKTAALNEDFSQDQDCRNGILASDVDRCVAKTSQETCTGLSSVITDMEASGVCGSADLCLD